MLYNLADSKPGKAGLEKAISYYEENRDKFNPRMMDYALMVFLTHNPKGRLIPDAIPPLELREPELVVSSVPLSDLDQIEGAVLPSADGLEWYREDPFTNEHHEHWHIVYPTSGKPGSNGQPLTKNREGELFFYMHQQMLARYDAERLAMKYQRVEPFSNYTSVIAEGYDPGPRAYSSQSRI